MLQPLGVEFPGLADVVALPALLDALDERFPETRISIAVNTSHDLAGQLSEGLLDIAMLSTPPKRENLDLELLGRQSVAWLTSPRLGLPREGATDADLLRQRILSTPPPSNIYHLTTNALSGTLHHPLRMNFCDSLGVIVRLVEAGSGLGILPKRLLQQQLRQDSVQVIETGVHLPMQEVFIGRNKGSTLGVLEEVSNMIRSVGNETAFCQ
ncbi:substrate-binding domain-containing protein [Salipiger mucosus]|uniref:Putative LysR-type regulator n=1 Tax=Salipiger mucosus DSM 16094 TaxID=1123237 RepID=S9R048_9RHOB|nr:substrate-binding domain-containing protein [Salipiger mucosus]EPX85308.1 putative LysR-type regulator [Salipiger mucosus DSM 16094]